MSYTITQNCTGCAACKLVCPANAIQGEKKSLHKIDPLICIECGACGRICPFKAVIDSHQNLCKQENRKYWMKPLIREKNCVSCGLCLQTCPSGVLDFAELSDHKVHAVAHLREPANCIGCAFCADICPVGAIEMQKPVK